VRAIVSLRQHATWVTGRRRNFAAALGAVLALMLAINLLDNFGTALTGLLLGPPVALALVVLSRRSGLTWDDLGLARRHWRRGGLVAAGSVVLVSLVYVIGVALPLTRLAFLDPRYRVPLGHAVFTALVAVPLSTVLIEEIAFRGVLLGMLTRRLGGRWAVGLSSGLFGLWHVLPSWGLGGVNPAAAMLGGTGPGARVLIVSAVVTFTALAGALLSELRRRSGSLLASAGLHWAVNGVGVLFAAALVTLRVPAV